MECVLTGKLTFESLKPCDLSNTTKTEIKDYFENSYNLNESLFAALKDESAFYKCPDRLRLPLIFYYGHTACVYVNKLILADLLKPADRVNFEFESIFETGVDEMSWDDTENYRMGGKFKWPALINVIEYRKEVKKMILQIIEDTPLELPITMKSPWWALFMGMEHERIHLETSSVLIRQLPIEMVQRPAGFIYGPIKGVEPVPDNKLIEVAATNVVMGKPEDFPSYGWDNEYGEVSFHVPKFEASRFPVTNREFLAFVKARGYDRQELWTDEGWRWKQFRDAKHPTFWVCLSGCKCGCGADLSSYTHCKPPHMTNGTSLENHVTNGQNSYCNGHSNVDDNGHQGSDEGGGHQEYRLRCMFDVVEMPWDWPVETNYHEAKAFCAWKGEGYRLPAEAEFHAMRGTMKPVSEGVICDIIYQDQIESNLNFQYGSSTPVNLYKPNDLGFHDIFGNVWEWVEDHFNGLPGFRTSLFYDDFSSPCFDGRHNGIMGGSWISTGDEASRFARYAFRRHFFQHCGFRLVRQVKSEGTPTPIRLVNTCVYILNGEIIDNNKEIEKNSDCVAVESVTKQYAQDTESSLLRQMGMEYDGTDSYIDKLVEKVKVIVEKHSVDNSRAMHVGCGTGKVPFLLEHLFEQMLALDVSARFIDVCTKLQEGDLIPFSLNGRNCEARRPAPIGTADLVFKQLSWLPNEVGFFSFILATSFDRAQNAEAWMVRFKEVLTPNGLLIIVSGGQWVKETLEPRIGKYFQCLENDKILYPGNHYVTAWHRV